MGQDRNAGNAGDRLKHSLTAEVLMLCLAWPELTYAETHAGAGCFDAAAQEREGKSHIADLQISHSESQTDRNLAGGRYHTLLDDWWSKNEGPITYPGSVVQSAIILQERSPELSVPEFRVTEACSETCERLASATKALGISPSNDGFQNRLDWLTENDNLVLIVDPYALTENGKLDKGQIDLEQLSDLLGRCWKKSACVIGFWYSTPQGTSSEVKNARQNAIKSWAENNSATFRCFGYWIYDMIWLGVGGGKDVVDSIPSEDCWKKSWLAKVVKEKHPV